MSELGNISKSFGKQINISIANTYSVNVLNSNILPANNLIVSAPVDGDGNDIGTYCLLITDNNGSCVRLTYTLQPGNGLNIDTFNTDVIKLAIDGSTLNTNTNDELQVNIENISDNKTISVENNKLQVNVNGFPTATDITNGVVMIDGSTTKLSDTGNLYVNADELDRANENSFGVITSDNKTVHIDSDGVISINTENLDSATKNIYGVVKVDGNTINSSYGNIYVVTDNLDRCTSSYFGTVKPDGTTMNVEDGKISVNTEKIRYATNEQYGVAKTDGITLVSSDGVVSVNGYDKLIADIEMSTNKLNNIEQTLSELIQKISV